MSTVKNCTAYVTFLTLPLLTVTSVKKLLTDALNKNQYLRRLELQQIKDMVECMYERTYQQGEYVIKQGEPGNHLFVLAGRSSPVWSSCSSSWSGSWLANEIFCPLPAAADAPQRAALRWSYHRFVGISKYHYLYLFNQLNHPISIHNLKKRGVNQNWMVLE